MSTKIYGIIAAENEDNVGETVLIDGIDDRITQMKDEHPSSDDHDTFFRKIGIIRNTKKIHNANECDNEKHLRCWNFAQVPFLYGEGELVDDSDHPNAIAAASIIKFAQRDDVPLHVGWSIDGGIFERRTRDGRVTEDKKEGKILAKTIGIAAALTVKPCNPKCRVFLDNDLAKSIQNAPIPKEVYDALKKSQSKHSFTEHNLTNVLLYVKLNELKKSLSNYFGDMTNVKCYNCGSNVRMFKSDSLPNHCSSCGENYTLEQLWKAISK